MFHEIFFYANHASSAVNDNVQFKSTFNKMHCNVMQTATTKFHYYVDDSISIVKKLDPYDINKLYEQEYVQ